MKVKNTLLGLAAAAFMFVGVSYADHDGHVVGTIIEGKEISYPAASFCRSEESAVSIIENIKENGMNSSIILFNIFVIEGECITYNYPVLFTPVRLVLQYGHALVAEVFSSDSGKTIYLISPNLLYKLTGDDA